MSGKGWIFALAAGAIFTAAVDGSAQQSQQQLPPLTWTKLCSKMTVAAQAQTQGQAQTTQDINVCRTFRERLQANGTLLMSAAIVQRQDEKVESLVVTVPLGVDLRSGLQARIDSAKPMNLTYARCLAGGCVADIKLNPETVKAMKTGQQLVFEAKGPLGKPVSVALPLAGLAAAYDDSPSDPKAYQETRQQLVNALRARLAGQISKALEEYNTKQQQVQQPQPPAQSRPQDAVPPPAEPQP
jgi:invasion protein IalB